ncbi:MAG: SIMPL domain-containing protein [Odoribacteraceae bacterium]|nr:SIMPL domain-containing protein [Odoribacteraceae bacterium]
MKTFVLMIAGLLAAGAGVAQEKNFIDMPYLETSARVDSMVTPDRVYISITLAEKDTRGKMSVEDLEQRMVARLEALGIDAEKQLEVGDLSSNFKKFVLKSQEVLKAKNYSLLVHDAVMAARVIVELEEEGISNVSLERVEFSGARGVLLDLRRRAVLEARENAEVMAGALGTRVREAVHVVEVVVPALGGQTFGVQTRAMLTGAQSGSSKLFANIEFRKIKLEAAVSVKFRIEP